jgi:hypothetical protein
MVRGIRNPGGCDLYMSDGGGTRVRKSAVPPSRRRISVRLPSADFRHDYVQTVMADSCGLRPTLERLFGS